MRILITSGGTKVPIDRVRNITNMSNGTFGTKIARAFFDLAGDKIDKLMFLAAKGSKTPFSCTLDLSGAKEKHLDRVLWEHDQERGWVIHNWEMFGNKYDEIRYNSFEEYQHSLIGLCKFQKWDIIIAAAAVSDYLVTDYVDGKVRSGTANQITLTDAPKIIPQLKLLSPEAHLVGFKLLVNSTDTELTEAAQKVLDSANCDFVVANDLRDIEAKQHRILIVSKNGVVEHKQRKEDTEQLAVVVASAALGLVTNAKT